MSSRVYEWHQDNQFTLRVDGHRYFPRLLEAFDQAQSSIDIEMYLVTSGASCDQVIDALLRAAKRGVEIRFLFDAIGSEKLKEDDRDRLRDGGVELRIYNPASWYHGRRMFHRDHRKLIIIDRRITFVGGTGFTDEFCQTDDDGQCPRWHEQMLEVQGPVVADWLDLFETEWGRVGRFQRRGLSAVRRVQIPPQPKNGEGYGRVSYIGAREQKEVVASLLSALADSSERAWLATPYFLPSWRIRRSLMRAARRGVDVRLLLCGTSIDHPAVLYAGQRYYRRLLKAGVRIFEFQPRFTHLKTAMVDNWVSLGSCNFDHWTLHWNLEANQQAVDPTLTRAVTESFENDFAESHEWTLARWRNLPLSHRLKIRVWGQINRWVMRIFGIQR